MLSKPVTTSMQEVYKMTAAGHSTCLRLITDLFKMQCALFGHSWVSEVRVSLAC